MSPFYVIEFEKWRAAPIEQRSATAWRQVARYGIGALFAIAGDDPADVIGGLEAGYGRVFRNWPPERIEEFLAWAHALRDAAHDQCELIELQSGIK